MGGDGLIAELVEGAEGTSPWFAIEQGRIDEFSRFWCISGTRWLRSTATASS